MNVLFRTDASSSIGTGHVMRCLALAQALRDEGMQTFFLCAELPSALRKRLEDEDCDVRSLKVPPYGREDCEATIAAADDVHAEWIVVDGYHFDGTYQATLTHHGTRVLWIDDEGHAPPYTVELVLNQNAFASDALYVKRNPATTLLLGCRLVLLRREFRRWRTWRRQTREKASRILLTLGGADPENLTGKTLQSLNSIDHAVEITVVLGSSNPHRAAIEMLAAHSLHHVTVATNVSDMTALMTEADLAIAAGGTTSYELAFLQIPAMTFILAENQHRVAEALDVAGCSINLGDARTFDFSSLHTRVQELLTDNGQRRTMAMNGRELVDGEGGDRVSMRLRGERLRVRDVRADDCDLLWQWANDPVTRAASLRETAIPLEDHRAWFAKRLADPATLFLIAVDENDQPLGSIRFAMENNQATLSFSLAPEHRGKGLGADLVRIGVRRCLSLHPGIIVHAYVKETNDRPAAIFRKLSFQEHSPVEIEGHRVLHFSMNSTIISS
ncbi:UDP-2,4-diacetamido-2,4,6-trideoxy-beta-L-altropyranose hydrolase [Candidatus Peregrinibacteria bacterium]|nr:UDP-2,4-diacetamido-2,4,6-trideoxy-beta-L-altropyranose hydrolase [Candidatus Peregrinibacteria bacterium]